VKSATHNAFGRSALNCRLTRSIQRANYIGVAKGGLDRFTQHNAFEPQLSHETLERASGQREAFTLQLMQHFTRSVGLEVFFPDATNLKTQHFIALGAGSAQCGIGLPPGMQVIRRRGNRQDLADWLDPVNIAMLINKGFHGLNRRPSSVWAKYADALRRISLACRNSRISRSSALISAPIHCRPAPGCHRWLFVTAWSSGEAFPPYNRSCRQWIE